MIDALTAIYYSRCHWFVGFNAKECSRSREQGQHCLNREANCLGKKMLRYDEALARAKEDVIWLKEHYHSGKNP